MNDGFLFYNPRQRLKLTECWYQLGKRPQPSKDELQCSKIFYRFYPFFLPLLDALLILFFVFIQGSEVHSHPLVKNVIFTNYSIIFLLRGEQVYLKFYAFRLSYAACAGISYPGSLLCLCRRNVELFLVQLMRNVKLHEHFQIYRVTERAFT